MTGPRRAAPSAGDRTACCGRKTRRLPAGIGRPQRSSRMLAEPRKLATKQVGRLFVELHRGADLLDLAGIQHGDPVADRIGLLLVVGDEDGGEAEPLLQRAQFASHADRILASRIGQRFVAQQHLGLDGDGTRHGDALLLAARELGRSTLGEGGEADQVECWATRRSISARGRRRSSSPKASSSRPSCCGHSA